MSPTTTDPPRTFPFGMHKGAPLASIDDEYLLWGLRTLKLSSGLKAAVVAELTRRGVEVPPAPTIEPPACRKHPTAGARYEWMADSLNRRHIRARCAKCSRRLCFVPQLPVFVALADAAVQEGAKA